MASSLVLPRAVSITSLPTESTTSSTTWSTTDIIYVSIMGPILLAAFLEWFLWLAAFCYCLYKAFRKTHKWHGRLLSLVMMILFVAFRGVFLPIMIVTLPLPNSITKNFPYVMVYYLQWVAFWTFAVLLVVPWLMCVYRITTTSLGRRKQIKQILDEATAPKIIVVMPVYKENPDVLLIAINSVVNCEYPAACIHVFLSFDGDDVDELYLATVDRLGIPVTIKDFPQSIDVAYNGARITVSKFPHGGKRSCQKQTYRLIEKVYDSYLQRNDDLFILFIDSDCILDKVCIQNFLWEMELKPGRKHPMLAMTGVITSTTQKHKLITILQDMEYVHGQLFERSVESACGSVTCLPGALTILRLSAFRNMAKFYFADKAEHCDDLFDYGKCHLGEDRWLTHLLMVGAKHRYQIGMCTNAFCKTEAVQTFRSLLKQRRRWFLGFITNEVCLLTDARLWGKYPLLCLIRFMQNTIRTTALLFFIMVISIASTDNKVENLPYGFLAVSLGLNYLLMFFFGVKLNRLKAWLYPIMFIINPFFNWVYMIYGIFTAGQRTWGGPRADAGAADAKVTPQEAIEHAQAMGDDLNVIPETFRPAAEARNRGRSRPLALQPPDRAQGRFQPAEELPGGYYKQAEVSQMSIPKEAPALYHTQSYDPWDTSDSEVVSIHTPRRLSSLLAEEERRGRGPGRSAPSSGYNSGDESKSSPVSQDDGDLGRRSQSIERLGRSRTSRREKSYPQGTADPEELTQRLSDLAPPQPAYARSIRSHRSTQGRVSTVREATDEAADFGKDDNTLPRKPGKSDYSQQSEKIGMRSLPSKRKRLEQKDQSPGEMV